MFHNRGVEDLKVNPMIGPSEQCLLMFGAKYAPAIQSGQWYRLMVSSFLSSGLLHLLLTLSFQLIIGKQLERMLGWWRVATVFVISGFGSTIFSAILLTKNVSVSSGGSLFGLFGLHLAQFTLLQSKMKHPYKGMAVVGIGCFVSAALGLMPFIDNFTHLGGFMVGYFLGCVLVPGSTSTRFKRNCHATKVAATVIGLIGLAVIFSIECYLLYYQPALLSIDNWCSGLKYINCLNILGWCNGF